MLNNVEQSRESIFIPLMKWFCCCHRRFAFRKIHKIINFILLLPRSTPFTPFSFLSSSDSTRRLPEKKVGDVHSWQYLAWWLQYVPCWLQSFWVEGQEKEIFLLRQQPSTNSHIYTEFKVTFSPKKLIPKLKLGRSQNYYIILPAPVYFH